MALGLGRRGPDETIQDTTAQAVLPVRPKHPRLPIAMGTLALVAVAVPFAVECLWIVAFPGRGPLYLRSDPAVIGIATRAAAGWHQLLGPYSRFGWHHPGPAYFYLQSLPSHLVAPGRAEFFGTAAINGVAGLLSVAAVWRRAGHWAALWSAVCVGYLALALGPASLRWPWNPDAVTLPLCLLAILCAVAATGSRLSLLGSLLIGSYLVQTDIGTAPLVATLLLVAIVAQLVALRTRASHPMPRARSRPAVLGLAVIGSAAFVAVWVPPLLQQIRDQPGNLTLLWRFFDSAHPGHGAGAALHAIGAVDSQLTLRMADNHQLLQGSHYLAVLAALAVALAALAAGLVLRQRLAFALGVASLLGQVVCIASTTRVIGPIYGYLVQWEIALPVVAAVGLGVAFLGENRRRLDGRPALLPRSRPVLTAAAVVLTVGTAVVGVVLGATAARLAPVSSLSATDVGQAWSLVAPQLGRSDTSALIDIRSHDSWELAAGLADQLDQHGVRPTVAPEWFFLFGTATQTGREAAVVTLYQRGEAPPVPPDGARLLGVTGSTFVYFQRPSATH